MVAKAQPVVAKAHPRIRKADPMLIRYPAMPNADLDNWQCRKKADGVRKPTIAKVELTTPEVHLTVPKTHLSCRKFI